MCAYINNKWCHENNVNIISRSCSPNLEILSLKIRPFYLPREFPSIILNVVYIPPDANYSTATDTITEAVHEQLTKSPESAVYITGDFNQCSLDSDLYKFCQYVNVNTRNDTILDLFYCNVKSAYSCSALAPLGNSDHNMLLFRPNYKPVLKTKRIEKKTVSVLDLESENALRVCLADTDWDVFTSECDSVSELCDNVSGYVRFCEQLVTVKKDIVIYPNSKPWVNKDIKDLLSNKQKAFKDKETDSVKEIDKSIKKSVWAAKMKYKEKLEDCFKSNDSKETWSCLKTITGYSDKKAVYVENVNIPYLNDMNSFFARFEDKDGSGVSGSVSDTTTTDERVVIEAWEVKNVFDRVNARKACGPDGIKPKVLRMCSAQLCYIYAFIMNWTLNEHTIPTAWKCSEIIPIPKRPITVLNDYRPVALTSVVMKCMEKLILKRIKPFFNVIQDPFQFAYRSGRSVEDAIVLFLDNVYEHLDKQRKFCRILFVDFSSAFNTINPSILIDRLKSMGINSHLIAWIFDFLTNRTQYVKFQNIVSNIIVTNTGSPQGCVLSPVLFTIYTNECQINEPNIKLIKFADDSCLEGLISNANDEIVYKNSIDHFTSWCEENKLLLNTDKTKELIIDFRIKKDPIDPVFIKNKQIDQVDSYKYLGITIDNKLNWDLQATSVFKKVNKRMYFLRKLGSFKVDSTLLSLFYNSVIQSIISFCVIGWGGNVTGIQKKKINCLIRRAGKTSKSIFITFDQLHKALCFKKINSIENTDHPLAHNIKRSVRSNRPLFLKSNTERYRKSFLPYAITLLDFSR